MASGDLDEIHALDRDLSKASCPHVVPGNSKRSTMKRIFLTGASAGIGLATAQALIASGHEVWGTSRDPKRIPPLPRLNPVQLDLSDRASVENSFKPALSEAGHFDVV